MKIMADLHIQGTAHRPKNPTASGARHHLAHGRDHQAAQYRLDQASSIRRA